MADEHNNDRDQGLSTARIEALADGVFAVALTLLVLEIRPTDHIGGLFEPAFLWKLFAFFLSFLALGVFWVGHHNQYFYIKHADRPLLWINILFLSFISLVPFAANLLGTRLAGTYQGEELATLPVVIYGINLTVCALVLYLHWRYGINNPKLAHGTVDPNLVRLGTRAILRGPVLYLIASGAGFLNIYLGVALFVLVSLSYVIPTHLDRYWRSRGKHVETPASHGDTQQTATKS